MILFVIVIVGGGIAAYPLAVLEDLAAGELFIGAVIQLFDNVLFPVEDFDHSFFYI